MKFLQYINEEYKDYSNTFSIDYILNNKIKKDCQEYLKLCNQFNIDGFYRGMKVKMIAGKKDVRQDRKGRLFKGEKAEYLNQWLENHNGARRDKSVIATSDYNHIDKFFASNKSKSDIYYIFPIGDFRYSYCKYTDMNFMDIKIKNRLKDISDLTDDEILTIDFNDYFVNNKDIQKAYNEKWEIWFQCQSYYFIVVDKEDEVNRFMGKL